MAALVATAAAALGAPEAALRLLLSMLLAYPAAWGLRVAAPLRSAPAVTLTYLTAVGFGIGLFNFGGDVVHSVAAVVFTYLSFIVLGPTKNCVLLNFIYHMGHLLVGYYFTGTDTYDIKWTMPHCVLVLRLIGLAFDFWDGSKPPEKLSASNKLTALRERPSLLEITTHVFFPASYLVGPQFSMVRLKKFIAGDFEHVAPPSCVITGLKRAALGLCYLAAYQLGTMYFPDDYFLTEQFRQSSFIQKHLIMAIWGKITLSKYISCWLLTEGACITFGLAYNGKDEKTNESLWDGCRNVRIGIYEGCTKFGQYVDSFNTNTNAWVAQYIYKRAAFLGSREASQGITLLFLALWHGFHSGYYVTFLMEFSIMLFEKQFLSILDKNKIFDKFPTNTAFNMLTFVFLKIYVAIFMGYSLIPFTLLSFSKWWSVYASLYYSGFVLYFPWMFVYKPILKSVLKPFAPKPISATQ